MKAPSYEQPSHSQSTSSCLKNSIKIKPIEEHHLQKLEKIKQKVQNPDLFLDLSLSTTNDLHQNPSKNQPNESEIRVFSCNYCTRKFYSSQALGGHQNAHKRQRSIARRGQRLAAVGHHDVAADHRRYSSMASLPMHGSFSRSFGLQVHSMIHNPCGVASPSNCTYGRKPLLQQPAIGRLPPENRQAKRGGGTRFDGGWRLPMAVDGTWDASSQSKSGNQEEFKKLDLSLKL